jgi:prepilin-type N-terminal cleavage/methylation domain-containing protein
VVQRSHDDGFSLVEVVIAMFLLGVLSLAVLPLIIGATRASVQNDDLARATAFGQAILAPLRAEFPVSPSNPGTCSDLEDYEAADIPDPAGSDLVSDVVVEPCPSDELATVGVTVIVRDLEGTLVELPTRVLVASG